MVGSHESLSNAGNLSTGVAAGGGIVTAVTANAQFIGVILTLLAIVIALVFNVLNYRLQKQQSARRWEKAKGQLVQQIVSEIDEGKGGDVEALLRTLVHSHNRRGEEEEES